jgi:H/ACA ribonucleoprotein complex subunit 3
MKVYVAGKKIRLDPTLAIGTGGEADVYDIGGGRALKLFKAPDHADLAGDPAAQQAARERLDEHQRKLRAFPSGLPDRVVAPVDLVTDGRDGRVVGYTMPRLTHAEVLLRYGDRGFRQAIGNADVFAVFRGLHATVDAVHRAGVVVGDFNDLNVLVRGTDAHLIDADSMQFGGFLCRVFTERFVDPLLCDAAASSLLLVRPHTPESDWYAFAAMLMRSLLYVEPYGGVYRPGPGVKVSPGARPLHRITVFHPEVKYPKPAERWDVLPDDLLHHLHAVFVKDNRGPFPPELLDARWTRCLTCAREHARALCPYCAGAPPAAVRDVTQVRGEVTSRRVFATGGTILEAAFQDGRMVWLYQDGDALRRETDEAVFAGGLRPGLRVRLASRRTVVGVGARVASVGGGIPDAPQPVDVVGSEPVFDTNARHMYWVHQGGLMRDGRLGPERIGDVLAGQTRIWVGTDFGFGFYRAGQLQVGFVFDAERNGINDRVALPRMTGLLTQARCIFGSDRCWFLTVSEENGRTVHRCALILRDGRVAAVASAAAGDASWLGQMGAGCAAGDALLVPTDDGIVRVEVNGSGLTQTRAFPDTEPFVDGASKLIAGSDGLYVVDPHEIRRLTLARTA